MEKNIILNIKEKTLIIKFQRNTKKYYLRKLALKVLLILSNNDINTYKDIMRQIWGFYDVNSRTLNSTISQLRKATNYNLTITHRIGIGYQLKEDILIL